MKYIVYSDGTKFLFEADGYDIRDRILYILKKLTDQEYGPCTDIASFTKWDSIYREGDLINDSST